MNLKLKSALQVAGFIVGTTTASVVLQIAGSHFSLDEIATGLTWFFLAFCIYMIYQINLNRLESEADTQRIINETKEIIAKYR